LIFGVHTLKFLNDLPGAVPITRLDTDDRPDASGPFTETVEWNQADQVVLLQMADAYGITTSEVQKLGATLMVFLASLGATSG
jgi:hypothetical protein